MVSFWVEQMFVYISSGHMVPSKYLSIQMTFIYRILCLWYTVLWLLIKLQLADRFVILSFNPVSSTDSPKVLFILTWNMDAWILRK